MLQSRSKPPPAGAEILVVGGGVIGASAAVRLQQAGAKVTLVDPGDEMARASFGNAGHVVTESAEPLASWSNVRNAPGRLFAFGGPLDFCWRDADLWLPWCLRYLAACEPARFRRGTVALGDLLRRAIPAWRDLAAAVDRPDLIEDTGHFYLWESEASARKGRAAMAAMDTGPATWRPLTDEERERLSQRFAGRPRDGVFFDNTVRVRDPGGAVRALWAGLEKAEGRTVLGRVRTVEAAPGRVTVTLDSGEQIGGDQVLVAGGARSASLMASLGVKAPLIAERGYHLRFNDPAWPRDLPAILFEDRWIYLTCFDSGVRVTGFTELGRPDTPSDPRKWALLRRHLTELGLTVPDDAAQWRGSRPTLPDFLPAIGRLSPQVLYAFGHQHIGMTLAAATAEAVLELAGCGDTPERLRAFDIRRFG
jgi:glycine/D-amino acid oxidase-like deaminating enzyme